MKNRFFVLLLSFLFIGCAANRVIYPVTPTYEKTYFAQTEDGWSLALHHYPPKGIPIGKPPVILCPGLNQNYLNWDLTSKWSFAQHLSEKGYDVWSVSFRGSGKSTKPGWGQFLELNQLSPQVFNKNQYHYLKFNWDIDDYIEQDIPTLLKFIKKTTGHQEVTWIGHSMGGMAILAYLGLEYDPSIKNLVLIGVAGKVNHPKTALQEMILKQEPLLNMSLIINTKNITNLGAPFSDRISGPLQILSYNSENMNREVLTRFYSHVIENTSIGVISQIRQMVKEGGFSSADGTINYSENYRNITANLLCIAGKLDNMAPPGSVLSVYHQVQSKDKTYRLMGVANGYQVDYGHNDLILGNKAPEEVYPYILNWLNSH